MVGTSILGKRAQWSEAFIWDKEKGMRSLKSVLENDYNLDLAGWKLQGANDVSDDGLTIVGNGINPDGNFEAWMVQLDSE